MQRRKLEHAPPPGGRQAEAEALALSALAFLAADEARLARFLSESGTAPETLRAEAGNAVFLGFVLDHLLQDEALLLAFCAESGLGPDRPARARAFLPGASET